MHSIISSLFLRAYIAFEKDNGQDIFVKKTRSDEGSDRRRRPGKVPSKGQVDPSLMELFQVENNEPCAQGIFLILTMFLP